ncbi:hypothetical protein [Streptomyces sp. NBC_01092]|uniref:hypothetical protein n=1 Tax=Streptomyces sp. NBC_01092 TaxID=2903748 RepID=UPI0038662A54|nr:hypothetical protein OG254_49055 [Streptomyces sp. NBC_01092]
MATDEHGAIAAIPPLVGYRFPHQEFEQGRWLPDEFVSFWNDHRVPRFSDRSENLPQRSDDSTRTLIAEGYAFVRITNIDWIDRQGRIEIRLLDEDRSARLDLLLPEVLRIGFGQFNLHRLHGLVTPGPYDVAGCLLRHGFVCEATVPYGVRLAGRPRAREIWARLAEDWTECC